MNVNVPQKFTAGLCQYWESPLVILLLPSWAGHHPIKINVNLPLVPQPDLSFSSDIFDHIFHYAYHWLICQMHSQGLVERLVLKFELDVLLSIGYSLAWDSNLRTTLLPNALSRLTREVSSQIWVRGVTLYWFLLSLGLKFESYVSAKCISQCLSGSTFSNLSERCYFVLATENCTSNIALIYKV
jgi:hypothetical protein